MLCICVIAGKKDGTEGPDRTDGPLGQDRIVVRLGEETNGGDYMARVRRLVSSNRLDYGLGLMKQLRHALESLRHLSQTSQFNAPTFNGEGEVELFVEQFVDMTAENKCNDKST